MEEKEVLQQENAEQEQGVEEKVEPQIDLSTEVDGEVAQFDQEPQAEVVVAPPIEIVSSDISKEVKEVSGDEKQKIEEAQQKANKEYHAVFGDRQIRKPSKSISIIIAALVFVLLAVFAISKIPLFYNCLVPTSKETMAYLVEETNIKEVEAGSEVWLVWYEYDEDTGYHEFNQRLPGNKPETPVYPSEQVFGNLDEEAVEEAVEYYQSNWLIAEKLTNQALTGEFRYVTVVWYQFESVEDSREFAEKQVAKYEDGNFEEKNVIFHQMGVVGGTTEDHVYMAWYNGQFFVEVYASDEETLKMMRNKINYA